MTWQLVLCGKCTVSPIQGLVWLSFLIGLGETPYDMFVESSMQDMCSSFKVICCAHPSRWLVVCYFHVPVVGA